MKISKSIKKSTIDITGNVIFLVFFLIVSTGTAFTLTCLFTSQFIKTAASAFLTFSSLALFSTFLGCNLKEITVLIFKLSAMLSLPTAWIISLM